MSARSLYIWCVLILLAVFSSASARRSCNRDGDFCPEPSDNMSPKDFTDAKIKEGPVVVFSKSYCPYCKSTKELFKTIGASIIVVELDERDDGGEIQDYLQKLTGGRSVPRVFVGGKFVGGNDDTQKAHKAGKLVPQIQAAGGM